MSENSLVNSTEDQGFHLNQYHGKGIGLFVLFFLSLCGNVPAACQLWRHSKRLSIYRLMFHLTIADLIVSFTSMLVDGIWLFTFEWPFGSLLCKAHNQLGGTGMYLSSYITALIAVNRAHVVLRPMYSADSLNRLMMYLVVFVYALSFTLSIPQVCRHH